MSHTYEIELDVSQAAAGWDDIEAQDVTVASGPTGSPNRANTEWWRLKAMTEADAIARVEALVAGTGAKVRGARMVGGA